MTKQAPTPPAAEADLTEETQPGAARWATWLAPLVLSGIVLWLMAALFENGLTLADPLSLVASAVAISAALTLGRIGLGQTRRSFDRKSRLAQHALRVVARLEQAADRGDTTDTILRTLRDEIRSALEPDVIELGLYSTRNDTYTLDSEDPAVAGSSRRAPWLAHQPVAVPMVLSSRDIDDEAREARRRGVKLLVPLGKPGWIGLGQPSGGKAYSREELSFVHLVSRAASVELQQASLVEAQHQHTEELQALYWIAQAVNFTMDVDDLMELIYTQLSRVIRLPRFYVALRDPDRDTLSYTFYVEDEERRQTYESWSASAGLTGVLLRNNMTIRTESYAAECMRRDIQPVDPNTACAWMGTALTAEDKAIGVMVASSLHPDLRFAQAEEDLFVTVAAYTAAILERQDLYARLESRARELATLNEIGTLLASSLDLDVVLNLVVQHAAALLDSEAGSLLLLDEESGDLVFRVSNGPAGNRLVGLRIPAGKGIAGAAFTENRPIISADAHQDARWYADFDTQAEFVTHSVIAVPLNTRGRTMGVLEVINRLGSHTFSAQDCELLSSFAAQAAIALENARLFTLTDQALRSRVQELTTLQLIDRQLNATLDYNEVISLTLDWSLRITGATTGTIGALHENDAGVKGIRFLAHRGYVDELISPYLDEELWPLSKGLVGRTIEMGETTLVTDVAADPHYYEIQPGMQAQLTVPIRREDRVIGAIALESADIESFDEERVEFVERLADHAAIAIDNARLFREVQDANAAKTEFISFVSHELKQPMTSIKGYADLLIKGVGGPLNEQQSLFVSVVRNNVDRMDRMVQDLLDISRIEAGRLKLDMGSVDPAEITGEASQAFEREISAKHQMLSVDVSPELPTITGDRGRLIQVLTNLLSNANKYTPDGGNIAIRAERSSSESVTYVEWRVTDDGIGMTPDEVGQLFTKYFRSKNDVVRSVQGTGLGLVITRSIVEMHGGYMTVESEYGGGTTFSFALPVSTA